MKRTDDRGRRSAPAPGGGRRPPIDAEASQWIDLGIDGCEHAVEIGRGGFGAVYRAWQPVFGRIVAVKVLSTGRLEGEARRRLRRELRAMGALSGHPHIVTVHSAGVTGAGNPYIVMGFESGGSLADRIHRDGPMPWEEAVLAGVRIAGALETAHRAGVLHRDVKPENVLLSAFGEPKLADFGVAQVEGAAATRTKALVASVPHAAPELLGGGRPSVASDVYALASTIDTLIRGRPAFAAGGDSDALAMISRIATRPVPPLSPEVPPAVAHVLARAMSKRPEDRPRSALELGEELRATAEEAGVGLPSPLVLAPETGGDEGSAPAVRLLGRAAALGRDRAAFRSLPGGAMSGPAGAGAADAGSGPTMVITGPAPRAASRRRPRRRTVVLLLGLILVVAAGVIGGMLSSATGSSDVWTARAPMPTARAWLSVATGADGRIYAIGGLNGRPLDTVEAYDPTADRWSTMASLHTARWGAAAASAPDGRIYAIGGYADRPLSSVEVYTPGDGWSQAAPLVTPRWAAAAVTARDGRIYVLGGFSTEDDRHALSSVEVYTPSTNTWASAAPMHVARGALAAVAGPDGRIYAIGGANGPDVAAVEVYTPETDSWAPAPPLPQPRSGVAAGIDADGRVHVIGGYGDHADATVDVYTPGTRRWVADTPLPVPLFTAVASTPGGGIYAIGGGTDLGGVNTVYLESPRHG